MNAFGGFNVTDQLPALMRYARVLTRSESAAEDLVHDALVRAYENRGSFRDGAELLPWLLSILHNVFISTARRARAAEDRHRSYAALDPTSVGPGQEHSVRLAQVQRAFANLPEEQRTVLHLVAVEGLSYQATAQALAIPLGTVMSRLGRARAALRSFEERPHVARPQLKIVGRTDER